mgnify:CR=1 FL=1
MAFRKRIKSVKKDKRAFTVSADRTHRKNLPSNPMRGGYRL